MSCFYKVTVMKYYASLLVSFFTSKFCFVQNVQPNSPNIVTFSPVLKLTTDYLCMLYFVSLMQITLYTFIDLWHFRVSIMYSTVPLN